MKDVPGSISLPCCEGEKRMFNVHERIQLVTKKRTLLNKRYGTNGSTKTRYEQIGDNNFSNITKEKLNAFLLNRK